MAAAASPALAVLDEHFTCDRYGLLLKRHCLRRQVERCELGGAPARPHCADGCEQGRALQARIGLPISACRRCGSGLVPADAPCETCASRVREGVTRGCRECGSTSKHRAGCSKPPLARAAQVLPTGRVAPPQSRIWTEKLPDPPFIPPSEQHPDVTVQLRCSATPPDPAPAAAENPERQREQHAPEPTPQDQEEAVPEPEATEKRVCSICQKNPLRRNNTTGTCRSCKVAPRRARVAAGLEEAPAAERKKRAKAAWTKEVRAAKVKQLRPAPVNELQGEVHEDVARLTDDELATLLVAVRAEVARRIAKLQRAQEAA